ncbi:hypothetical protein VP1G_03744 [Cytospora mali]|uniref:Uncharacterized protein n=1 Tax=Cytospora mali TaxID=578113 RepID=A0A194UXD5_CYTMA|nr:hypothetical protein VP1G_03744 [Valsa mali var. pyri (nom. inval.)]
MPFHLQQAAIRTTRSLRLRTTPWAITTTAARFYSPGTAPIKFDQTKKSNDPDGEPREGQHDASSSGKGSADAQSHPAKQPDPQSTPSKSTGVRGEGPGGKAGEGQRTGGVQQKDKEAVEGAKQHSVRKPIPSEGNTPEGRGGSAL